MRAAIYEADDVRVLKGCGNIYLAHESLDGLIGDGDFREQRLYSDGAARRLFARQHHSAHPATTQNFYHVVAGNGLRFLSQLVATVFAKVSEMLVRRRSFGLIASPAVETFDHHDGRLRGL